MARSDYGETITSIYQYKNICGVQPHPEKATQIALSYWKTLGNYNVTLRVIPCLLIHDNGLVKTVKFKDKTYIGDLLIQLKFSMKSRLMS